MKQLVVGYIGNGKSTNRYHLPFSLQRKETVKIKKIYDRHPDVIKWKRIEGVEYTDDLESLLNDEEINLIVVCTPVKHYEYAMMVLDHHKNVLVEKPFVNTYKEAKEIFDKAASLGLHAECYQNRRYDSDFLTAQKVIESGIIGEITEVEMHFDYYRPEVANYIVPSGYMGALYGHACHTLDQVISYFGRPERVVYDVRQLAGPNHMNDYYDLDLFYGNLKVCVRQSYYRVKERSSITVYGKKGMFDKYVKERTEEHLKMFYMPDEHPDFGMDKPEHYGTLIYYDDNGNYHEEKYPTVKGNYASVYDGLYDTIILGKEPRVKPEETLCVMEILEKGIKDLKFDDQKKINA